MLCQRHPLPVVLAMPIDQALHLHDACRRTQSAGLADALWVARVSQAEQKAFLNAYNTLNRSAGRG